MLQRFFSEVVEIFLSSYLVNSLLLFGYIIVKEGTHLFLGVRQLGFCSSLLFHLWGLRYLLLGSGACFLRREYGN